MASTVPSGWRAKVAPPVLTTVAGTSGIHIFASSESCVRTLFSHSICAAGSAFSAAASCPRAAVRAVSKTASCFSCSAVGTPMSGLVLRPSASSTPDSSFELK